MNSVGELVVQRSKFYIIEGTNGAFSAINPNSEIMIINSSGEYCFRTIISRSNSQSMNISGTYCVAVPVILNASLPASFAGAGLHTICIPHFNTLTINAGVTVSPAPWDGKSGGIVAFRVKGDCVINGSIITSGLGKTRDDLMQLTHASLIDNFVQNKGGAIFIACGGKLTAPSTARLGATWSGDQKGGASVTRAAGRPGGAGYGGSGAGDNDNSGTGGAGGVGGGGGSGDGSVGGAAGQPGQSGVLKGAAGTGGGGAEFASTWPVSAGGTQGVAVNSADASGASGGGGAGGNSGIHGATATPGASSGASIILIANTIAVDLAAISTGGAGGNFSNGATGGGGTGFCYVACKEMK